MQLVKLREYRHLNINYQLILMSLICCCSVAKWCPTLWDSMDCSMPGSSVLHYLLEFAQDSCPLSQRWYLTILSSATSSCCLHSFPASGSFPMNQLFASGGQNAEPSALTLGFPMNIQGWFPFGLTGLLSWQSKGLSIVQHHNSKASVLCCSVFFMVQLSQLHMNTG